MNILKKGLILKKFLFIMIAIFFVSTFFISSCCNEEDENKPKEEANKSNEEVERVEFFLDMDIENVNEKSFCELYINERWSEPIQSLLYQKGRNTYSFDGKYGKITHLRIDPTNDIGVTVKIYSFKIVTSKDDTINFTPKELSNWQPINIEAMKLDNNFYEFKSSTGDPILWGPPIDVKL